MNRRAFLQISLGGAIALQLRPPIAGAIPPPEDPFKISLAEWSLNRSLFTNVITNLDFPRVAKRDYEIDTIEFVDQFFADKARDETYLKELKTIAEGEGVSMGLIMIDRNGPLGAEDGTERAKAVENTKAWIDAAAFLGCHAIRVNARGASDPALLSKLMAESCATLADYAAPKNINVTIENHGGPSSDPDWLIGLMREVNKPNFGTLPDFGNFPAEVDRYDAVERFMPFAKAVSAKSTQFAADGTVTDTDFPRMMRIVRDGGYSGHVGVESVGKDPEEEARHIRYTRDSLRAILEQQRACQPIFYGADLHGWVPINGGEWSVEDGVLIGRNGQGWSTDPAVAGSWLRTEREYENFRLELQFMINEGGNSGVFIRSKAEQNPAFTGYELQILDGFGQEPSLANAGALFDVIIPRVNAIRPAGEWNTLTVRCWRSHVLAQLNFQTIIDADTGRTRKGYIGLQNHDEKSEVRFKNIRAQEISSDSFPGRTL